MLSQTTRHPWRNLARFALLLALSVVLTLGLYHGSESWGPRHGGTGDTTGLASGLLFLAQLALIWIAALALLTRLVMPRGLRLPSFVLVPVLLGLLMQLHQSGFGKKEVYSPGPVMLMGLEFPKGSFARYWRDGRFAPWRLSFVRTEQTLDFHGVRIHALDAESAQIGLVSVALAGEQTLGGWRCVPRGDAVLRRRSEQADAAWEVDACELAPDMVVGQVALNAPFWMNYGSSERAQLVPRAGPNEVENPVCQRVEGQDVMLTDLTVDRDGRLATWQGLACHAGYASGYGYPRRARMGREENGSYTIEADMSHAGQPLYCLKLDAAFSHPRPCYS
jgi:hypothetical protein